MKKWLKKVFWSSVKWLNKNFVMLTAIFCIFAMLAIIINNQQRYENYLIRYGNYLNNLGRKIYLNEDVTKQRFLDSLRLIHKYGELSLKGDEALKRNIKQQKELQKELDVKIQNNKPIDLVLYDKIKSANVHVFNKTNGGSGSGTRIKIKNKYYILTVAHVLKKETDLIVITSDESYPYDEFPIIFIKQNIKMDLALFRIEKATQGGYLNISEKEPMLGSELIVIGNPSGMEDIITDGILCKKVLNGKYPGYYIFSNISFFGNSGGAVLYRGRIVGVVSMLQTLSKKKTQVHYGWASGLQNIKTFLKEI